MPLNKKIRSCEKIEALLIDYLDDNLDQSLRDTFDSHLKDCERCRNRLKLQQEWLKYRPLVALGDEDREIPEGMNSRIMAAIRYEAASREERKESPVKLLRRPGIWYKAASVAAAVILLVAVFQVFHSFNMQRDSLQTKAASGQVSPDYSAEIANDSKGTVYVTNGAVTGKAGLEGISGGWQTYSGSLSELPSADCLFSRDAATEESVPGTDIANPTNPMIFDLLNDSEDLRILTSTGNPEKSMILAAYQSSAAEKKAEQIKVALPTCATPVRIEIIKYEELPELLNALGPDLYASVLERSSSSLSWILILIGE